MRRKQTVGGAALSRPRHNRRQNNRVTGNGSVAAMALPCPASLIAPAATLLLLLAPGAAVVHAQDAQPPAGGPAGAPPAVAAPAAPLTFIPRLGASFNGAGVGYSDNAAVEAFFPFQRTIGRSLTFAEGRFFSETDNDGVGGNVLIGHRVLSGADRILGGYVSYDGRDSGNKRYSQVGVGFETFSPGAGGVDFRVNGYFPVGGKKKVLGDPTIGSAFFVDNRLELEQTTNIESALTGFDAEVGTPLLRFPNGAFMRGFVGIYNYDGEDVSSLTGWRAGVASRPNDLLDVSFAVQQDERYDLRGVLRIALFTSRGVSGSRNVKNINPDPALRLADTVARQPFIAVAQDQVRTRVNATDLDTSQQLRFQHVVLTNTTQGDGTQSNPFNTLEAALAQAQAGDIVYVEVQGTGPAPTLGGFTVPAGVSVVSAGPQQRIDTTQQNNVLLPGSGTGRLPAVSDTITLQSGSTLDGFAISNTAGVGVQATGVSNVAIRDNTIIRPGLEGIKLVDVTGNVTISGNTVRDALTIVPDAEGNISSSGGPAFEDKPFNSDLGIAGGVSGIRYFNMNGGNVALEVSNNTVSNSASNGILIGIGGTTQLTAQVRNNNSSNNVGSGIFPFFTGQSRFTGDFVNNTINNNQGRIINESGIRFAGFDQAIGVGTLSGNTANGNKGMGLFTAANDQSQLTATVIGNRVEGNYGNGIFAGARRDSILDVRIERNIVSGTRTDPSAVPATFPNGNGILVGALESGRMNAVVADNQVGGSGSNGIYFFVAGTGQATGTIQRNSVSGSVGGGIVADIGPIPPGVAAATATVSILDNQVTANQGKGPEGQGTGGIIARTFNNSTLTATITGNLVSGNATDPTAYAGLGLLATGTSTLIADVRSNTILNSGTQFGFQATSATQGPGKLALRLRDNVNNGANGLIRPPGTLFQAQVQDNVGGPVIIPVTPVDPLPDGIFP